MMKKSQYSMYSEGSIAERLEKIRVARGYRSARAMAISCGITATAMQGYFKEKAAPGRVSLQKIASTFGVDFGWLVNGEGTMDKSTQPSPDFRVAHEAPQRIGQFKTAAARRQMLEAAEATFQQLAYHLDPLTSAELLTAALAHFVAGLEREVSSDAMAMLTAALFQAASDLRAREPQLVLADIACDVPE